METKKKRKFTLAEDKTIIGMARAGAGNAQIAETLGRVIGSVQSRRNYLIEKGIDIPAAPKSSFYVEIDGAPGTQVRIDTAAADNPVAGILAIVDDMRAAVEELAATFEDVKRKEDLFRQMSGMFGGGAK